MGIIPLLRVVDPDIFR